MSTFPTRGRVGIRHNEVEIWSAILRPNTGILLPHHFPTRGNLERHLAAESWEIDAASKLHRATYYYGHLSFPSGRRDL
jgi:hypothetical protein